jgi:hypothetical protein
MTLTQQIEKSVTASCYRFYIYNLAAKNTQIITIGLKYDNQRTAA